MRQWKQSCVTARKRWCFVITIIVIIPSFQADKKHQCSCFTNAIMKILILTNPKITSNVPLYVWKWSFKRIITTRKILWGQTKIERILPGPAKWISKWRSHETLTVDTETLTVTDCWLPWLANRKNFWILDTLEWLKQ